MGCIMTYEPERETGNLPKTREIQGPRGSDRSVWMAALVIAVMIGVAGYFYLQPNIPSPNMRATDTAPVTVPNTPPPKSP
jgi:hypothetical protein